MKADEMPEYAGSFASMAGFLNLDRARLYELKRRDSRFPAYTTFGWPVARVSMLIRLRRMEGMTTDQRLEEFGALSPESWEDLLAKLASVVIQPPPNAAAVQPESKAKPPAAERKRRKERGAAHGTPKELDGGPMG